MVSRTTDGRFSRLDLEEIKFDPIGSTSIPNRAFLWFVERVDTPNTNCLYLPESDLQEVVGKEEFDLNKVIVTLNKLFRKYVFGWALTKFHRGIIFGTIPYVRPPAWIYLASLKTPALPKPWIVVKIGATRKNNPEARLVQHKLSIPLNANDACFPMVNTIHLFPLETAVHNHLTSILRLHPAKNSNGSQTRELFWFHINEWEMVKERLRNNPDQDKIYLDEGEKGLLEIFDDIRQLSNEEKTEMELEVKLEEKKKEEISVKPPETDVLSDEVAKLNLTKDRQ